MKCSVALGMLIHFTVPIGIVRKRIWKHWGFRNFKEGSFFLLFKLNMRLFLVFPMFISSLSYICFVSFLCPTSEVHFLTPRESFFFFFFLTPLFYVFLFFSLSFAKCCVNSCQTHVTPVRWLSSALNRDASRLSNTSDGCQVWSMPI